MRFQVPQFIEVEDKIFGPLTFKQFIYIAGGVGICVLLFTFLPKVLAFFISIPVFALSASLAFFRVNDKPFINMVEAFLKYTLTNKLYLWRKEEKQIIRSAGAEKAPIQQVYVPKLSDSKLKELTWSLDIKENQNPVTQNDEDDI